MCHELKKEIEIYTKGMMQPVISSLNTCLKLGYAEEISIRRTQYLIDSLKTCKGSIECLTKDIEKNQILYIKALEALIKVTNKALENGIDTVTLDILLTFHNDMTILMQSLERNKINV